MSNLISKRAQARSISHFAVVDYASAPPGFKPHTSPLHLDGGTPNVGFFPVELILVAVKDYPFQDSYNLPVGNESLENVAALNGSLRDPIGTATAGASNIVITTKHSDDPTIIDILRGLQYSETSGHPQLKKLTRDLVKKAHPPAHDEWDTVLTLGAGDGLNKACDLFLDEGDIILIEEFTFTPVLQNVRNAGGIPVPIKLDMNPEADQSKGIDLEYLTDLLENWDELRPEFKGKKPKVLYTIASGQNPTGFTQDLDFRKKVYALAEKYDFGIIEDDPYGYLTLPPFSKPNKQFKLDDFLTLDEYLTNHLKPSYLTIDTSKRVVRVETFSKLFAPGMRLGFIVASKEMVTAVTNYAAVVTRFPSGASQIIVNNVIQKAHGGVDGWLNWVLKMRLTYASRRDAMLDALYSSKAYKKGFFKLIDPQAGMFVSAILNFPEGTDVLKKVELLQWKLRSFGVYVVAGINMAVDKKFSLDRGNFFRLTYAPAASEEEISEGSKRFAAAVDEFFEKGLEY